MLSNRYLTNRFLPDKAIDLIDEAASKLRIEIDSLPTEIDVVQRRILQFEIEQVALGEGDPMRSSKERLDALVDELASLNAQVHEMKQHWEGEKQAIDAIRSLKEELGQLGQQLEREKRSGRCRRDPLRAHARARASHRRGNRTSRRVAVGQRGC